MEFKDKTLICVRCNSEFTFTKQEQEFFRQKGYRNEPKYCPSCRRIRKAQREGRRFGRQPTPTVITCSKCGKQTTVPFIPRGDRPVYCRECYNAIRSSSG